MTTDGQSEQQPVVTGPTVDQPAVDTPTSSEQPVVRPAAQVDVDQLWGFNAAQRPSDTAANGNASRVRQTHQSGDEQGQKK
jgi:hypothetical protein